MKNLIPKDGNVTFYPHFFDEIHSQKYLDCLLSEVEWRQEPITIFGKKILQPRLTAFMGDLGTEIRYSGISMKAQVWSRALLDIKKRIEPVANTTFNCVLLNQYRDENDSMGWHRDNEKELGINPIIGSVSFGATRTFQFRHADDKNLKKSVELTNGSFLLMAGATQHHWYHSIPKTKSPLSIRINLTFRTIL